MIHRPLSDWLPITLKEVKSRGWEQLDVILISGDAYVDHPAFGPAVIGRIIESYGFKIGIIPQPNWRDDLHEFKKLGEPKLFFGVTAGCMDSMVNHYTANLRKRSTDAYTPAGEAGFRPDYAVNVYTQILKKLYPDVPVVIGGIEASLRRVTHYDYWSDKVRRSILLDAKADILLFGNAERALVELEGDVVPGRAMAAHMAAGIEAGARIAAARALGVGAREAHAAAEGRELTRNQQIRTLEIRSVGGSRVWRRAMLPALLRPVSGAFASPTLTR